VVTKHTFKQQDLEAIIKMKSYKVMLQKMRWNGSNILRVSLINQSLLHSITSQLETLKKNTKGESLEKWTKQRLETKDK